MAEIKNKEANAVTETKTIKAELKEEKKMAQEAL